MEIFGSLFKIVSRVKAHKIYTLIRTTVKLCLGKKLNSFHIFSQYKFISRVKKMKLYYLPVSPPARAVLLGIRNLGLSVELITVDLFKMEHLKPEFIKLNSAHQIPVLEEDGFVLCESRAILGYLVNKFKPGSKWYPADARKRALIDQRLYYDTVVFSQNATAIVSYLK